MEQRTELKMRQQLEEIRRLREENMLLKKHNS